MCLVFTEHMLDKKDTSVMEGHSSTSLITELQ